MDGTDHRILAELTADARVALVELAARVHLSRNAVKQRIERMERDGVIAGYTVVRGAAAARRVTAIVMVYRTDRMRGAHVVTALERIPEVVRCDILSGEFDLFVTVRADTMDRIGEIWEMIAALPGVENTVTSLSLTRVIDRP
ncbi:Lrp/AsnC family transcriptional regulator [Microbacterium sp. NPDC089698]|uniref:Leucine-responsive regulatory protein n=1 Tax=Microbacterium azadirachtae TaxID=582680 RepID=A0A0F0LIX0_9MICO|nr:MULTISPECIES: Lrp/AsnC family transcriptional regulator [Microbacterium]KJL32225.1 Leucine-responsive regulatory protein [Microbacterium azadirachtae]MDR2320065.1 Lrp/AsnC family transcriptional regulator [Microbacterium sp.]